MLARLAFCLIVSSALIGCIAPVGGGWNGGGWGAGGYYDAYGRQWGPGFRGGFNRGWGNGWQQPYGVQPGGFAGGPMVTPGGVMGGWNQTPMAAQQRAQQQAAGFDAPVPAYPNPARPMGYQVGTGQPVYSAQQCWQQGCVMP